MTPNQIRDAELGVIRVGEQCLHGRGIEKSTEDSVSGGATGFGNDLNDAPSCLSILRLEASGLYLYFLHE